MTIIWTNKRALGAIISVVLLSVLSIKINWVELRVLVAHANWRLVILGASLTIFYPLFSALRWLIVAEAFGIVLGFRHSFGLALLTFAANIIMPARAGDFIKVYLMRHEAPVKSVFSAVIAELTMIMLALLILGLFGSIIILQWLYIYVTGIFLLLIILIIVLSNCLANFIKTKKKLRFFYAINESTAIWHCNKLLAVEGLLLSILCWLVAGMQVWFFFKALGATVSFLTVTSIFPVATLLALIPVTFAGLGVREAAFGFLFLSYAPLDYSIATSLLYFLCSYVLLGLVGVVYILFAQFNALNVRKGKQNEGSID